MQTSRQSKCISSFVIRLISIHIICILITFFSSLTLQSDFRSLYNFEFPTVGLKFTVIYRSTVQLCFANFISILVFNFSYNFDHL